MKRRNFILAAAVAGLLPRIAQSHHGWSGFDAVTPVYLRGTVKRTKWENPHAELVIEVSADLDLPEDLAARILPAQTSAVDGPDILRRTVVPARDSREWTIELAPLFRVRAWGIEEPAEGDEVEAIGYILRAPDAPAYMRAEYLFHAGKAFALRSGPA